MEADWGDHGSKRLLAHTVVGGLTGGSDGALGAMVGTLTAPTVAQALHEAGVEGPLASGLIALAGTTVGALAGGLDGAGSAYNEVMNNYLNHYSPDFVRLSEKERYEQAVEQCQNGVQSACEVQQELAMLSRERDMLLARACMDGPTLACQSLANEARAMGNVLYGGGSEIVHAYSPEDGAIRQLNTPTMGAVPENQAWENTYHYRQAQSLSEGLPLLGAGYYVRGGITSAAAIGAGFDITGQTIQGGEYRPGQTFIAMGTAATFAPFVGRNMWVNSAVGGAAGGTFTVANNQLYNEDNSVLIGTIAGTAGGLGGTLSGNIVRQRFANTSDIYYSFRGTPFAINVPVPSGNTIGDVTQTVISNSPSLLQQHASNQGE